jgi:hypothetical protein
VMVFDRIVAPPPSSPAKAGDPVTNKTFRDYLMPRFRGA